MRKELKGNTAYFLPDAVAWFTEAAELVWKSARLIMSDLETYAKLHMAMSHIRFYESEVKARPFLAEVVDFMKCVIKVYDVKTDDEDVVTSVHLGERLDGEQALKMIAMMAGKGYSLIPWNESKMGGNAPKLYFMKTEIWAEFLDKWGIREAYDRLVKTKPSAVPSRLKKLFGYLTRLDGITVVFGPVPFKGVGLMHPDTIQECGMNNFDKLGGMMKVSIAPSTIVGRGILLIDPSEDKWGLGTELLSKFVFKDVRNTTVIKSSELNDRIAKFSRDVQLLLGIDPKLDIASEDVQFSKTRQIPNLKWLFMNFGYTDLKRNCRSLNKLGIAIMRGRFDMNEALAHLFDQMLKGSRSKTPGIFGVAAPMFFAPTDLKLRRVWLLRYPNRVMVETYVRIDEYGVIYVDPELWETMGGDYDGDLAFTYPHSLVNDSALPVWPRDKEMLKSLMPIAEKTQSSTMSLEESFAHQLDSSVMIGITHNTLSFLLESMLANGASRKVVIAAAMKLSNKFIQPFIDQLKYHVGDMVAPSVIDMLKCVGYFIEYSRINRTSRERTIFNAVHGRIDVMKVLEAANIADPNAHLFSERLVAQLKVFLG